MSGKFITRLFSVALVIITGSKMATSTVTGTYSVTPSDFVSIRDEDGAYFLNGYGDFYGPLHLPSGATVTNVTYYWCDMSKYDGHFQVMSANYTSDLPGEITPWVNTYGNSYDDLSSSIATSFTIDSDKYYYIHVWFPYEVSGDNLVLYGVKLTYEIPFYQSFLTTIRR